jgi:hypothetical protein
MKFSLFRVLKIIGKSIADWFNRRISIKRGSVITLLITLYLLSLFYSSKFKLSYEHYFWGLLILVIFFILTGGKND